MDKKLLAISLSSSESLQASDVLHHFIKCVCVRPAI